MANIDVEAVAKRVLDGVLKESTVEAKELDLLTGAAGGAGLAYQRFVMPGDVVWEVRKPVPGRAELTVFAIFAGEVDNEDDNQGGDVRLYAIPTVEGFPFVRYTASRLHPTLLGMALDEKRFVEQLALEWESLGERFGVTEGNDRAVVCPECDMLTETTAEDEDADDPDPVYCGVCGKKLPVEAEVD